MGLVAAIFRNFLGKPVASDFRDSAEHFVSVLRETGIGLTWGKDELLFIDDLVQRLAGHNEYRDAVGCYFGELLIRNFEGAEWVPGHALGPAVKLKQGNATKQVFPLGWVYRRADGGAEESIARKLHDAIGFPEKPAELGTFTDEGQRVWPEVRN